MVNVISNKESERGRRRESRRKRRKLIPLGFALCDYSFLFFLSSQIRKDNFDTVSFDSEYISLQNSGKLPLLMKEKCPGKH